MCLVIATACSRSLELISIEQVLGIEPPVTRLSVIPHKVLQLRVVHRIRILARLRSRVADIPVLVQLLCDVHDPLRSHLQYSTPYRTGQARLVSVKNERTCS